jgi:hypothetical protein
LVKEDGAGHTNCATTSGEGGSERCGSGPASGSTSCEVGVVEVAAHTISSHDAYGGGVNSEWPPPTVLGISASLRCETIAAPVAVRNRAMKRRKYSRNERLA